MDAQLYKFTVFFFLSFRFSLHATNHSHPYCFRYYVVFFAQQSLYFRRAKKRNVRGYRRGTYAINYSEVRLGGARVKRRHEAARRVEVVAGVLNLKPAELSHRGDSSYILKCVRVCFGILGCIILWRERVAEVQRASPCRGTQNVLKN